MLSCILNFPGFVSDISIYPVYTVENLPHLHEVLTNAVAGMNEMTAALSRLIADKKAFIELHSLVFEAGRALIPDEMSSLDLANIQAQLSEFARQFDEIARQYNVYARLAARLRDIIFTIDSTEQSTVVRIAASMFNSLNGEYSTLTE